MRRVALVSTASLAALGLVALGGASASAAELPDDADLFSFTYETFWGTATNGALSSISELPDTGGKYGADFDATSGLGYFFADGSECVLYSIDVTTGVSTEIGPMGVGVTDFTECDALNVASDGTLRVADQDGVVLTVDKTTGATISSVITDIEDISFIDQAPDGTFYAGSYVGGLFTYNPATGAGTLVDDTVNYFETGVIDGAGTLWYSSDGDGCSQGLWSLNISNPSVVTFQGDFLGAEGCEGVYALLVTGVVVPPAPQLAATGSAPTMIAVAPFALLALFAGAAALVVTKKRQA